MTRDRRFKQAVRKLMRATGQNYLAARASLRPHDSANGGKEASRMVSNTQEISGNSRYEVILRGEHDLVTAYLDEVAKHPRLTDAEEMQLGREKEAGERLTWCREHQSRHPQADVAKDAEAVRRGRLARKRLTEANLGLVVSIARRYQGQGLGVLALIEAGNHGLVRAIDRFDGTLEQRDGLTDDWAFAENVPEEGSTFATFATPWIVTAIHRALDVAQNPRIPRHGEAKNNAYVQKLHTILEELPAKLGREPTVEEVATDLGFTSERARRYVSSMLAALDIDPREADSERARRVLGAAEE